MSYSQPGRISDSWPLSLITDWIIRGIILRLRFRFRKLSGHRTATQTKNRLRRYKKSLRGIAARVRCVFKKTFPSRHNFPGIRLRTLSSSHTKRKKNAIKILRRVRERTTKSGHSFDVGSARCRRFLLGIPTLPAPNFNYLVLSACHVTAATRRLSVLRRVPRVVITGEFLRNVICGESGGIAGTPRRIRGTCGKWESTCGERRTRRHFSWS